MFSKGTIAKISYVNLVCTVLIIVLHSNRYKYFPETPGYERVFLDYTGIHIASLAMNAFYVMTGFLLFKDVHSGGLDGGLLKWYASELKKRVKSLLIPYFLWNSIWTVFVVVITYIPFITSRMDSFKLYDGTAISVFQGIFMHKYNGVFWYVASIILLCLLSPFIYLLIKNRYIGFIILCISMIFTTGGFEPLFSDWASLFYLHCGLFFFLLGSFISVHHFELVNKKYGKGYIAIGAVLCLSSAAILCFLEMSGTKVLFLVTLIFRFLRFAGFWMFMDVFRNIDVIGLCRISFFIYAMHRYVEQASNKLFELFLPHIPFAGTINTCGGVIITLTVIISVSVILSKLLPSFFSMLNGGRNNRRFD